MKKKVVAPAPGTLCSILIPSQRYFDELMTGVEGEHAVQSCLSHIHNSLQPNNLLHIRTLVLGVGLSLVSIGAQESIIRI